jgi:hypothetical protein
VRRAPVGVGDARVPTQTSWPVDDSEWMSRRVSMTRGRDEEADTTGRRFRPDPKPGVTGSRLRTGCSRRETARRAFGCDGSPERRAMGGKRCSVRPCVMRSFGFAPQSTGPGRQLRTVRRRQAWQHASRRQTRPEGRHEHRNPTSGSGPRDRTVAGEKTAGGVRNPEGGTCRVRQARVKRTLLPMSLKGRRTPGGEAGSLRAFRPAVRQRTLRGRPSLRKSFERLRSDRTDGGRPRGRGNDEEGAVNQ